MTARDRSKDLFNKGKQNAERVRAAVAKRTEKSETMQSAVEKIGTAGKWSLEKISDAQRLVENKMKQFFGVSRVTDTNGSAQNVRTLIDPGAEYNIVSPAVRNDVEQKFDFRGSKAVLIKQHHLPTLSTHT